MPDFSTHRLAKWLMHEDAHQNLRLKRLGMSTATWCLAYSVFLAMSIFGMARIEGAWVFGTADCVQRHLLCADPS